MKKLIAAALFLTLLPALALAAQTISMTDLRVVGNQIQNGFGQSVFIHGVNRMGTEYHCIQGHDFGHGPMDQNVIDGMKAWNVNAVRVPLNEHCWLGINSTSRFVGKPYRDAIVAWVNLIASNNMIAIVDLHWSAPGAERAIDQDPMPNVDHSIDFWRDVANTFKGNRSVIFDLFNEPYPLPQDPGRQWPCWRDGRGACPGNRFNAVGMQELVNTVRATGATNILALGGVINAGDLRQWLNFKPHDPLNKLAASWHNYSFSGCADDACFRHILGNVYQHVPLIVGEIGANKCDRGAHFDKQTNFIESIRQGYLAWVWQPVTACGAFGLVKDHAGTPSTYGLPYRNLIRNLSWTYDDVVSTPRPTPRPTPTPAPAPALPPPPGGSVVQIHNLRSPGKCLQPEDGAPSDRDPMSAKPCDGNNPAQAVSLRANADGSFRMLIGGWCIATPGGYANGTRLALRKCSTSTTQTFAINGGRFGPAKSPKQIVELNANDNDVTYFKDAGASNQLWNFVPR
ncbi:MAG: cellulase family glycosylhydrolase [Panacagrimonas sp.]